ARLPPPPTPRAPPRARAQTRRRACSARPCPPPGLPADAFYHGPALRRRPAASAVPGRPFLLTFDRSQATFLSTIDRSGTGRRAPRQDEPPPGDARPPRPAHPGHGPAPRPRGLAPHRGDHAGHVRGHARVALPRAAPARGRRVRPRRVGRVGDEAPGPLLR